MAKDDTMNTWSLLYMVVSLDPSANVARGMMFAECRLDEAGLDSYLREHLEGFPNSDTKIETRQFTNGANTPTFYLCKDGKEYVIRQKPVKETFQMDSNKIAKEFKLLSVLGPGSSVPVPRPLLYCEDVSILGTEFYVMEYIQGRIFNPTTYSQVEPAAFRDAAVNLARIHELDFKELKLDFLKPWIWKEQVPSLIDQYKTANSNGEFPSVERLADWLLVNLPDDATKPVVIHGDYRIGNIIYHPAKPEIAAVLDWEMAHLGHPLEDVAWFCAFLYHIHPVFTEAHTWGCPRAPGKFPPEEELLRLYCEKRGIPHPPPNWNYFLVFACFRFAQSIQAVKIALAEGTSAFTKSEQVLPPLEPFLHVATALAGLGTNQ